MTFFTMEGIQSRFTSVVMSILNALRRHPGKIVAFLLAGFLCIALVDIVLAAREAARRSQCKNNLKQIGLALHNYHDTYNCFPPAVTYGPDGKPWHSWRVLLVPFLEASPFWSQYKLDEPWNGPSNSQLATRFRNGASFIYRCPTDVETGSQNASYFAVIGENTMWPPRDVASLDDATDPMYDTPFVVEVSHSGVHWMEPRDLQLDAMSFEINASKGVGIRCRHGTSNFILSDTRAGAHVMMVDGAVQFLHAETPPRTVRSMLIRNDGKPMED